MKMKIFITLAVMIALLSSVVSVSAYSYGFKNITANSVNDAAIGEAQLFVDVSDPGNGQVLFTFLNNGPEASSITDIYFDDGTLLAGASIFNYPGVSFSWGACPQNLPGGQNITPVFQVTAGFAMDSDPPTMKKGINPDEHLAILFSLQFAKTFNTVIADLNSGALRIGIHVQGFADGDSESFINTNVIYPPVGGTDPVPEPATMLLLGSGLLGMVGAGRKKILKKGNEK